MRRSFGLVALLMMFTGCFGTVGVEGEYYDDGVYPPPAYIATTAPVYYDGVPCYWYGGRWYHHYGEGWRAWRSEPGYLRDYRVHGAVGVSAGPVRGGVAVHTYAPVRQSYARGNMGAVYRGRHR
jgi:hypothetical protein